MSSVQTVVTRDNKFPDTTPTSIAWLLLHSPAEEQFQQMTEAKTPMTDRPTQGLRFRWLFGGGAADGLGAAFAFSRKSSRKQAE